MRQVVSELIISIDGSARGTKSPGYYGYYGPEFGKWLKDKNDQPHRTLMGRKTYEMLNGLPEANRDDAFRKMTEAPGWVFSTTLNAVEWPGLEIVQTDV